MFLEPIHLTCIIWNGKIWNSDFISIFKVDNSNPHEIISIYNDLQEVLQKYIIFTPGREQKAGITLGKVYGHK